MRFLNLTPLQKDRVLNVHLREYSSRFFPIFSSDAFFLSESTAQSWKNPSGLAAIVSWPSSGTFTMKLFEKYFRVSLSTYLTPPTLLLSVPAPTKYGKYLLKCHQNLWGIKSKCVLQCLSTMMSKGAYFSPDHAWSHSSWEMSPGRALHWHRRACLEFSLSLSLSTLHPPHTHTNLQN